VETWPLRQSDRDQTCAERSWCSLKRPQHVQDGGRSWHSPAAFSPSPSRLWGLHRFQAGVEGLVHVLANELRAGTSRSMRVAPGQVQTDLFLKGKSDARIDELKKMKSARTARHARRHGKCSSFLGWPRGRLDQQPSCAPHGGLCLLNGVGTLQRHTRHQVVRRSQVMRGNLSLRGLPAASGSCCTGTR